MDNKIFKGLVILLMTLSPLTTIVNAAPPAGKGNNKDSSETTSASALTGGISTFIVDRELEKIDITGTGLDAVLSGTLGSQAVSFNLLTQTATTLEIPFDANIASAVTSTGNYEFSLDGNFISLVYLDGPIIAPSTSCPCQSEWDSKLTIFQGSCTEITDGTQVSLSSHIDTGSALYFVSTAFDPGPENSTNSFCAIVEVDPLTGEAVPGGFSHQETIGSSGHDHCYTSMQTTFCSDITIFP